MNISKLLLGTLLITSPLGLNAMGALASASRLPSSGSKESQQDAKAAHAQTMAWQCIQAIPMEEEGALVMTSYKQAKKSQREKARNRELLMIGSQDGLIVTYDAKTLSDPEAMQEEGPIVALAASQVRKREYIAFALQDKNMFSVVIVADNKSTVRHNIETDDTITKLHWDSGILHIQLKNGSTEKWFPLSPSSREKTPAGKSQISIYNRWKYSLIQDKKQTIFAQNIKDPENPGKTKIYTPDSTTAITCIGRGIKKDGSPTESQFDFMSGSDNGTIRLWDHEKGCVHTFKGHVRPITALETLEAVEVTNPTTKETYRGPAIASASDDGVVMIWGFKPVIESPKKEAPASRSIACFVCSKVGTYRKEINPDGIRLKRCSKCKDPELRYCSRECQEAHWPQHKKNLQAS